MPRETQAEVFIRTLTELLDAERERQKERLRRRHKAHAERFVKAFQARVGRSGHPSQWAGQGGQTASDGGGQFLNN